MKLPVGEYELCTPAFRTARSGNPCRCADDQNITESVTAFVQDGASAGR